MQQPFKFVVYNYDASCPFKVPYFYVPTQFFQITTYEGILGTTEDQAHPWVATLAITFTPKQSTCMYISIHIHESKGLHCN